MKIVTFIFLIFIFVIGCRLPVRSQDKCDLQIKVYEFKGGDSENFPIKNYKIKLINADTKKSVKTRKVGEDTVVSGVNEESYIAMISKDGFQKTEDKISLDCSLADAQNTATEIIFLWKGDSRKTFKTYSDNSFGTRTGFVQKKDSDSGGVVNNGAVTLEKPVYPRAARYVRASGAVNVRVLINELGYVVSAKAVSGHPLLQSAAVEAAKKSKFKMTLLEGLPVKVNGIIVYNFVP